MRVLLLGLIFIAAASASADGGVKTPPFERVQLGNGTVLMLMERHDVPLVAFNAIVRGGALSDPADRKDARSATGGNPTGDRFGTSSLLAGMLEKGAGSRDANAFATTVASVGGKIETSASIESIAVSGSFLARDQQLMVELLADMLQRPSLDAAQFESLRSRYIEFIRSAKDSDLAELLPIYGMAALFGTHPYGRPVNGSEASLAALEHADLQRYYRDHVGADRLIIAVAGDFKTAQLKQTLTRAFAGWRKAAATLPPVPTPARIESRRVLLVDAPESVQSYFWAGNLGVSRQDPRRASLDVVNTLFGGRFTSMLNSELRIRTGLSYGAASKLNRLSDYGNWQMSSFTQTARTADAIDLAFATLDKLHAGAPEPDMLESGKTYVQGQFPLGFETAAQWSYQLANLELYRLGRDYIDGYAPALAAVSADSSKRVIDEVFPASSQVVLVVIGNASAIRDGLAKYGPITEMKLADPVFQPPSPATPAR